MRGWLTTRKQVLLVGAGAALCLLATPAGALAGSSATRTIAPNPGATRIVAGHGGNKGDVWTDNVGQPAGPGHEQDPHLACADINLWGASLADGQGTYEIDGWPPSGSQVRAYASTWTYNTASGGDQVTSVINVARLIAAAIANGDAPVNKQGYHFKLQFSQDPQKHKTFWVNCPGSSPPPSPPPVFPPGHDTCGYPDTSSTLAATVFNENEVAQAIAVYGQGSAARIAAFGTDEASVLLGIEGAVGNGNGHVSNPSLGDMTATDVSGRPLYPALFVTDLTSGGTSSRSGDWQQGGHAAGAVDDVFGSWATATGSPAAHTYSVTKPSSANGSDLGAGADAPPSSVHWNRYGTEVRWNAASMGLAPGHAYRFQVILHDGDQNKSGGDTGELCTTLTVPPAGPPALPTFNMTKTVTPTGSQPVGSTLSYTVTVTNTGTVAGSPGTVTDQVSTSGGATYTVMSAPAASDHGAVTGSDPTWMWAVQTLQPGAHATLTLALRADSSGTITNTSFNSNTNCAEAGGTACTPSTPIPPPANPSFSLSKAVTPTGTVEVGTPLSYIVTLANTSAVAGDPGAVSDIVTTAGGATYTVESGPTVSLGSVTALTGGSTGWSWSTGVLQPHESETLRLVLRPTHDGSIDNNAVNTNTNCPSGAMAAPCGTHTPVVSPHLTLTKTVDRSTAHIGDTVTYVITVTSDGSAPATGIAVDDLMGGDAGFRVNDGTNGTQNSFSASPQLTITKGSDPSKSEYTWGYASLAPGDSAIVSFTAVILAPGSTSTALNGIETLTNTAAVETPGGVPPVTVTTTAPFSATAPPSPTPPPGGVQGIAASTPSTGAGINITVAGFLFLGGLGLILLGVMARRPEPRLLP